MPAVAALRFIPRRLRVRPGFVVVDLWKTARKPLFRKLTRGMDWQIRNYKATLKLRGSSSFHMRRACIIYNVKEIVQTFV